MVRMKISQSSAQRKKRGQTAENHNPEPEVPVGLNNNGPYAQTEKNGLIHTSSSAAEEAGDIFGKLKELKITVKETDQEESVSSESNSEVSKFESKKYTQRLCSSLTQCCHVFHV